MLTCYSPVRRSSTPKGLSARLACVKHAASVRPEPGSNSPTKTCRNNHPGNKQKCCQRNPHQTDQRLTSPGYKHNWHWLIKHPVEFSKNNHTPTTNPTPQDPHPGHFVRMHPPLSRRALLLRYPLFPPCQTGVSRSVTLRTLFAGTTIQQRLASRRFIGFRQDGRSRSPASSSVSLPVDNLTRSVPPHQIRLAAIRGPARTVSVRGEPLADPVPARFGPPGLSPCLPRSALAERKLRARGFDRQIRGARPASHHHRELSSAGQSRAPGPADRRPRPTPGRRARLRPSRPVGDGDGRARRPRTAEHADRGADGQRRGDQQRVHPEEAGRRALADRAGGPGPRVVPDGDPEPRPDHPGPDPDPDQEQRPATRQHHGWPVCQRPVGPGQERRGPEHAEGQRIARRRDRRDAVLPRRPDRFVKDCKL